MLLGSGIEISKSYSLALGVGSTRNFRVLFLSADGKRLCVDTKAVAETPALHKRAKGLALRDVTGVVSGDSLHSLDLRGDRQVSICLGLCVGACFSFTSYSV